jgi:hypothetical protein
LTDFWVDFWLICGQFLVEIVNRFGGGFASYGETLGTSGVLVCEMKGKWESNNFYFYLFIFTYFGERKSYINK